MREAKVALRNCGRTGPVRLDTYIAECRGYSGLERALSLGREGVIAVLRAASLRERGGAGRPVAERWRTCAQAEADAKYVVCNALDADPRSAAARKLLSADPHSVLEGLLVAAYAVGARHGYVCVGRGASEEIALLEEGLEHLRRRGLVGDGILGSEFSCDLEAREIPPSLVAGEDGALLAAVEGRQPLPDLRYARPAERGLWGQPTLVESAETLAVVSALFQRDVALTADEGAEGMIATKIVTVCGDDGQERTTEIELGVPLAGLIEELRGPCLQQSSSALGIKAVQIGGPGAVFLSGDRLDIPVTHEDLEREGARLGSGSIRVFEGDVCAVETTRDLTSYLQGQSCGKCVSCREVSRQVVEILTDIAENRGTAGGLDLLRELSAFMRDGSICEVGRSAADPIFSSLELFPEDYRVHIDEKRCPAGQHSGANTRS